MSSVPHLPDRRRRDAFADLRRQNDELRARAAELIGRCQALAQQVDALQHANADARSSRRATLNVLEDAVASRRLAEELNQKLESENGERRRAEATLRVSEQRVRALVANLPGGAVFVVDRDLRCEVAEGEALRKLGLDAADFVGRTVEELLPPERAAELGPIFRAALEGQPFVHEHEELGHAFISRGVPLRGEGGAIEHVLAVCFDITARRQAERQLQAKQGELEAALEQAQAAHRAKDQFIAALSHELRTPLTPVLIAAGMNASDASLPSWVREQFETIRANVQLEARLIDDLLDQTSLAKGMARLKIQVTDLHLVLVDALRTVAADFAQKRIVPEVHLRAPASVVDGDPVRLQQVFWNVLRNAAKFTAPRGRVTVTTANRGEAVEVTITDTGIGMTGDELGRVFQPFIQGEHAADGSVQRFGGLGLGLTISREFVELHHGTIEAFSAGPEQGARFTITLPRARVQGTALDAPRAAEATAVPVTPSRRQPWRALLVEDHSSTRAALKILLSRRGYTVIEAATVREALDRGQAEPLDVVVSDLGLPDGSGHDVIKHLHLRQPQLPAIALSGFGMKADVDRALAAGFSAHLTKPVGIEQLDALLQQMEEAAGRARPSEAPHPDRSMTEGEFAKHRPAKPTRRPRRRDR